MPLSDEDLSALYQESTATDADRGACPDAETIARAAAADLTRGERDAVAAHIERCPACAVDFRIGFGLQGEAAPLHFTEQRWRLWGGGGFLPRAVAASLVVVTSGLLAWNTSLRQRTVQLESELEVALQASRAPAAAPAAAATPGPAPAQPYINVPVIDLLAPSRVRGAGASRQVVAIAPDTALVTLIVNTAVERQSTDYMLDLRDAAGQTLWSGTGLRPDREGTLSLALPGSLLRAGEYEFLLFETARRQLLHRYPITIVSR